MGDTVKLTGDMSPQELETYTANLECLLAALAMKFGRDGVLPISEAEISATSGRTFVLDLGLPDGSVRVKAVVVAPVAEPETPKAKTLPEITHIVSRRMQ